VKQRAKPNQEPQKVLHQESANNSLAQDVPLHKDAQFLEIGLTCAAVALLVLVVKSVDKEVAEERDLSKEIIQDLLVVRAERLVPLVIECQLPRLALLIRGR